MSITPKQRMLNAYRGVQNDRPPVAPEFWTYYPAKVLGVSMVEYEREIPFWKSLKTVFELYDCEGWGLCFPEIQNENLTKKVNFDGIIETTQYKYKGKTYSAEKKYSFSDPAWLVKHLADDCGQIGEILDMLLDMQNEYDYDAMRREHESVGESYLLEVWCGAPFFDTIAELTGFENAIMYFMDEEKSKLLNYQQRYIEYQLRFIESIARNTPFESFMVGCNYSCDSLIGPNMWREWDKPCIKAMCERIHQLGKLLHIHFHGKSMSCISDFAEIGIDAVCPFERPSGGDVDGLQGLKQVRKLLDDRVTFNGNVHTVDTLIFGDSREVIKEVREIKQAFDGCNRFIIGSGDQVGRETPEENIIALIEEAKALWRIAKNDDAP